MHSESGKKTRCLVTGASGFLGSHLVDELLARGYQVTCLVRKTSDLRWLDGKDVRYLYADLAREPCPEEVAENEIIFHTAGLIATTRPCEFYEVNQLGTRNLFERMAELGGSPTTVVVSSLASAGPSPDGTPITEERQPHPVSHYGRSKLLGEKEALKFADRMKVVIVRPPVIYGPRDRGMLKFFASARRLVFLPGLREKWVSMLYVKDVVDGIISATNAESGEVFFLASERPHSWREVGEKIVEVVGAGGKVLRIPHCLLWTVAGVSSLLKLSPFLTLDKARELTKRYWVASPEKAKRLLGFSQKVPLEEGVQLTAIWYRERGFI